MSSDTTANFSSQSVITGTITADIWEVPEVPAIACGMEDTTDKVPGDESSPTSEDKVTEATVVTVKDPVTGVEVEVDCGELSDATEGEAETGKSKEVDCKKTEAPESTEKVTNDCKDEEEEKEKAAEDAEVPAIEKEKEEEEKEKVAEDIEAPAVDEEKAEKEKATEEVKTPVTEKEKENAPENTETQAIEKEKEAKPQNESITEEKEVNKEDGVKTGADESKESEVQKTNTESPNPPKNND